MLLVDTSVWVLVGRGTYDLDGSLLDEDFAVCPPIVQEALQGADEYEAPLLRALMFRLPMLDESVPFARFEYAIEIYTRCRRKGKTIRSSIDCLIAATAVMNDVPLLHNDRDFDFIAEVAPLQTVRPFTRS